MLYAGENDLGWPSKQTPETVLEDFKCFVEIVRRHFATERALC